MITDLVTKTSGNWTARIQKDDSDLYPYILRIENLPSGMSQEVLVFDDGSLGGTAGLNRSGLVLVAFMANVMRLIIAADEWGNGFPIDSPTILLKYSSKVRTFVRENYLNSLR